MIIVVISMVDDDEMIGSRLCSGLGKVAILKTMKPANREEPFAPAETRVPGLTSRPIAAGDGWSIREFICRLGPADRPFEEQHMQAAISAVLEGSFQYR
ncbi:MAG: hypothetical protein ACJ8J7_08755, partial [Sulfurifustaceae bacterium]